MQEKKKEMKSLPKIKDSQFLTILLNPSKSDKQIDELINKHYAKVNQGDDEALYKVFLDDSWERAFQLKQIIKIIKNPHAMSEVIFDTFKSKEQMIRTIKELYLSDERNTLADKQYLAFIEEAIENWDDSKVKKVKEENTPTTTTIPTDEDVVVFSDDKEIKEVKEVETMNKEEIKKEEQIEENKQEEKGLFDLNEDIEVIWYSVNNLNGLLEKVNIVSFSAKFIETEAGRVRRIPKNFFDTSSEKVAYFPDSKYAIKVALQIKERKLEELKSIEANIKAIEKEFSL